MAILAKEIETPEIVPNETRSQDLAFFMPQLVDLGDFKNLHDEILGASAAVYRSKKSGSRSIDSEVQGLEESLKEFEGRLQKTCMPGSRFLLSITDEPGAPKKNCEALYSDYSNQLLQPERRRLLIIPAENITGVKALSYASTDNEPDPIFVVRIKTRIDKPVEYYAGPGVIGQQESGGSWFHFRFANASIALISAND